MAEGHVCGQYTTHEWGWGGGGAGGVFPRKFNGNVVRTKSVIELSW